MAKQKPPDFLIYSTELFCQSSTLCAQTPKPQSLSFQFLNRTNPLRGGPAANRTGLVQDKASQEHVVVCLLPPSLPPSLALSLSLSLSLKLNK